MQLTVQSSLCISNELLKYTNQTNQKGDNSCLSSVLTSRTLHTGNKVTMEYPKHYKTFIGQFFAPDQPLFSNSVHVYTARFSDTNLCVNMGLSSDLCTQLSKAAGKKLQKCQHAVHCGSGETQRAGAHAFESSYYFGYQAGLEIKRNILSMSDKPA